MSTPECWTSVLVSSMFGFALGVFGGILAGKQEYTYYSQYGFEFGVSILGGRAYEPRPQARRLPLLPKAVLTCLLASVVIILLLHGCGDFLEAHLLFCFTWLTSAISTSVWLVKASALQRKAEEERSEQLQKFLSDANAPVPQGTNKQPAMMTLWNCANVALFAALISVVAFSAWHST